MNRAIFLDKDGTLIHDIPYNVDPDRMVLCDGAAAALAALHRQGYRLIVITNQSGVAHGYFPEAAIAPVALRLRQLLAPLPLAGFYYCPHHPAGAVPAYRRHCHCRKPRPGLIHRAALAHGIDLSRSWFIGDILHDVEAGNRAGCRTILIDNGNETEWDLSSPQRRCTYTVKSLRGAADSILQADAPAPAHGP